MDAEQSLLRFIQSLDNPQSVLFWAQIGLSVAALGYVLFRYASGLRHRPKFTKQDILFQEYFASGSSRKNFLTKLGGASNCLRLVVTKEMLWVTSWFPFSLFTALYDLEHVILLRNIRAIESRRTLGIQSLLLTFVDGRGKSRSLSLKPKNLNGFVATIQANSTQPDAVPPLVDTFPYEPNLNLTGALKRYWLHLLAVGLFPTAFFVGAGYFHLPAWVFIPLFFAVMIYGNWPSFTRRVPFTYQFVMGAVWLGGAVLAGFVIVVLHAMILWLHR